MDFAPFDKRGYPVVSVPAGYAEWARDYEATVATGLDRTLLKSASLPRPSSLKVQGALGLMSEALKRVG